MSRSNFKTRKLIVVLGFVLGLIAINYSLREITMYMIEQRFEEKEGTASRKDSDMPGIEHAIVSNTNNNNNKSPSDTFDTQAVPENIKVSKPDLAKQSSSLVTDDTTHPYGAGFFDISDGTMHLNSIGLSFPRENATLFSLVRNSDLYPMLSTIRNVEDRFNKNFHYDWVFANDQDFNKEFIQMASRLVSGNAYFVKIPTEMWSLPEWIDSGKAQAVRTAMRRKKIKYGSSESYRHMCRFNSGFFYDLEIMKNYKYYWRVEPEVKFRCDINYDPFKTMKDEDKIYGFNLAPLELHTTVESLWGTVRTYMAENKKDIAKDNNFLFLTDDDGESFNMCHFWSNFEIADMDFFRGEKYRKFFDYLDHAGGIFYERWGDAPIHTIAVSIFLPKDKLKFIEDTGYFHYPNGDCPRKFNTRLELGCECIPSSDFTWSHSSCIPKYFDIHNLPRPEGAPVFKYMPIHDSKLREAEEERIRLAEEKLESEQAAAASDNGEDEEE